MATINDCQYISLKDFLYLKKEKGLSGGILESPFGLLTVRALGSSICGLGFLNVSTLHNYHSNIFDDAYRPDEMICQDVMNRMTNDQPFSIILSGTPFQHQVWKELQNIKKGQVVSYRDLALRLGNKNKVRAVASAVGKNPLAWIVPCHRVVPQKKGIGQYYWGSGIKELLLNSEGYIRIAG